MPRCHTNLKRPRMCETCTRVFISSYNIKTVHNPTRVRWPCSFPGCDKTYQNKTGLNKHLRMDHVENPTKFPCTLCRKEFKVKTNLERHIATHTTEKTHNCSICARSFAGLHDLKRHEVNKDESLY